MVWKCPSCGYEKNDEDNLLCSCGFRYTTHDIMQDSLFFVESTPNDHKSTVSQAPVSEKYVRITPKSANNSFNNIETLELSLEQPPRIVFFILTLFVFFIFYLNKDNKLSLLIYGCLLLLMVIANIISVIKIQIKAIIDFKAGKITIYYSSLFLIHHSKSFELSQFKTIRSYLSSGKSIVNFVELASINGEERLIIARLPIGNNDKFMSIPTFTESAEAQFIRNAVSFNSHLIDRGFTQDS